MGSESELNEISTFLRVVASLRDDGALEREDWLLFAEQARRKLRNGRGVRTPYNAIVLREFVKFQRSDPFEDVPQGETPPPPPIFEERRFVQGRLF
jgi:hypothetical protein